MAAQDNLVDGRAEFAAPGLDQPEFQIAGREFESEQIAGDSSVAVEHHQPGGMGVFILRLVVDVAKANRIRESADGRLTAGQDLPSALHFLAVGSQHCRACLLRLGNAVRRIDADGHDVEVFAGFQRQVGQGGGKVVQGNRADVVAGIPGQLQHRRFAVQQLAELDRPPGSVLKTEAGRNFGADVLIEPDGVLDLVLRCIAPVRRLTFRRDQRQEKTGKKNAIGDHCAALSASSRIACSIGIWAIPRWRSIQP